VSNDPLDEFLKRCPNCGSSDHKPKVIYPPGRAKRVCEGCYQETDEFVFLLFLGAILFFAMYWQKGL